MNTIKSFTLHDVESDDYSALLVQSRSIRTRYGKKKRDLAWIHANKWSSSEAKAFDKAIADTEKIVPGDW